MNNFQEIFDEEDGDDRNNQALRQIQTNVFKTLNVYRFVGQIVEVYLPKVISMFVIASGGTDDDQNRGNRRPPSTPPNNPPQNSGPQAP